MWLLVTCFDNFCSASPLRAIMDAHWFKTYWLHNPVTRIVHIYSIHTHTHTSIHVEYIYAYILSQHQKIPTPNLAKREAKSVSSSLLLSYAITLFTYSFVTEKLKLQETQRKVCIWHFCMRIRGPVFSKFCLGFCLRSQLRLSKEKLPAIPNQAHVQFNTLPVYSIIWH